VMTAEAEATAASPRSRTSTANARIASVTGAHSTPWRRRGSTPARQAATRTSSPAMCGPPLLIPLQLCGENEELRLPLRRQSQTWESASWIFTIPSVST
jgi:hypothetical protein